MTPVRYFYDTEFIEDGRTIELISIGVVAEDGREFYAISTDFDPARANLWVAENVLDKLPPRTDPLWRPRAQIREELFVFLTQQQPGMTRREARRPELWAWVGAYDHVVLAQLWGEMANLPREMPRYTRELRQLWELAGCPELPAEPAGKHDALVDARFNAAKYRVCAAALA